jgi:hypothetical protein
LSAQSAEFFKKNFMFVDRAALGPVGMRRDMEALRAQWTKYVEQMPSPR